MIIDKIRDFLYEYRFFNDNNTFINVNYLGTEIGDFSVEPLPVSPVVKVYINGDKIKRYEFALVSKNSFNEDHIKNIENCGFFEDFESWIEQKNYNSQLPLLGQGMESKSIEIINNGILINESEMVRDCMYQISLRLTYYKKKA